MEPAGLPSEPPVSAQIEVHQTVDPMPHIRAESAASIALPDTRGRVREAHIDPAPRLRARAGMAQPAAAFVPQVGTSSPTHPPARGGVEVTIGRIELEITAAPAPPPQAAVTAAPSRALRPAPAFNPHRHYLRGG
jgi:hypothetical protein